MNHSHYRISSSSNSSSTSSPNIVAYDQFNQLGASPMYYSSTMTYHPQTMDSDYNDKRSAHNALERQRREGLNNKFQELAHVLPSLRQVRRPSKSMIVAKSLEFVSSANERQSTYQTQIQTLKKENEQLMRQAQLSKKKFKKKAPVDQKPNESKKRKHTDSHLPVITTTKKSKHQKSQSLVKKIKHSTSQPNLNTNVTCTSQPKSTTPPLIDNNQFNLSFDQDELQLFNYINSMPPSQDNDILASYLLSDEFYQWP